jgi:hypothetical protein
MNEDEKRKLKTFIGKHWQVIKHLRAQLNKRPSKAAPAASP